MEGNLEGAALEFIQLQLLDKGGIVMLLIVFLSIVAAVIVIERLLYFRGRRSDEEKLLKRLANTLQRGHLDEALGVCEQFHNPLATLVQAGIRQVRERRPSVRELRDRLMETANLEIPKDERFLSALGTIAHIAPLLGLLGTVTGNIRAFGVLGEMGAITDPALLSRGISEALLTTAAGIIVSIPAIIFYNALVSKVNHRIIRLENRASELAVMLTDVDQASPPRRHVVHNGIGAIGGAADGNGAVNGNGTVNSNRAANSTATVPRHGEAPRHEAPRMDAALAHATPAPTHAMAMAMHPAGASQGETAPLQRMEPVPNHFEAVPMYPAAKPAPPAHVSTSTHVPTATHVETAPPRMEAMPGPVGPTMPGLAAVMPPHHMEPVPSHLEAVPRSTAPVPTHIEVVPTGVAAVPTRVETVPTT